MFKGAQLLVQLEIVITGSAWTGSLELGITLEVLSFVVRG